MTTLNVLIDATQLTTKKAGVGIYGVSLIRELSSLTSRVHLFILAQDDDTDLDFSAFRNVTMIWVKSTIFRKLPLRFLLEQVGIPVLVYKHRIDVVHSLHYSFPLFPLKAKKVVTFHDMTFLLMPEVHEKLKVAYFGFFIKRVVNRVDGIIFVSNSTLNDFQNHLGQPKGLRRVIPHGKNETFHPNYSPKSIEDVRRHYGLPDQFILFLGTVEPRKNITRLVEAFEFLLVKHPDLVLVIAGQQGWMCNGLIKTITNLHLESRVIFIGYCPEHQKPLLLSAASVFVYPSLYEGFGMPVLEAIACGTPTVTSNTSSMPEVAGSAALTVNPNSTSQLAIALELLISDPNLRKELQEKSVQQAALFTWRRTAVETFDLYGGVSQKR